MHYDLTDLRLFMHAVASGSFSGGARRANIAISALSERMKALELQIGKPLFLRRARGCDLTAAGREFVPLAQAVLTQAERLEGTVAGWRNQLTGKVSLLANSNAISSFLPEILGKFLARYPDVALTIREALSDDIASTIRTGGADLGVVADTANLDGLTVRPFRTDHLVVLVPVGHHLARRRKVALAEVIDEPLISLTEDAAIEKYLACHAAKLGRAMNIRIRLRSYDSVARVVAANTGIAIVPASTAGEPYRLGGVKIVALSDDWSVRNLVTCRLAIQPDRQEVRRLEDAIAGYPHA